MSRVRTPVIWTWVGSGASPLQTPGVGAAATSAGRARVERRMAIGLLVV